TGRITRQVPRPRGRKPAGSGGMGSVHFPGCPSEKMNRHHLLKAQTRMTAGKNQPTPFAFPLGSRLGQGLGLGRGPPDEGFDLGGGVRATRHLRRLVRDPVLPVATLPISFPPWPTANRF